MPDLTPPLRVGLLGFSDIARRRFVPALRASGFAHLAAIGTGAPDEARAWIGPDAEVFVGSPEAMLDRPDLDLVYVSTGNATHAEWTCRALARRHHVLCEKPLGLSTAEVERMLAAARASGTLLFENVMFLHHPQHHIVRKLLGEGRIGPLRAVRTGFGFTLQKPGNYRLNAHQGGGACHDVLVYIAACARLFVPGTLRKAMGHVIMAEGIDVAAQGIAHGDEVLFQFSLGFRQQYECFYELVGTAGTLRLDRAYSILPDAVNTLLLRAGNTEERIALPAADHFVETLRHVAHLMATPSGREAAYAEIASRHDTIQLLRHSLRETA